VESGKVSTSEAPETIPVCQPEVPAIAPVNLSDVPVSNTDEIKLNNLTAIGFDRSSCEKALKEANGDANAAARKLLNL